MAKTEKKTINYVDDKLLYTALIQYKMEVKAAAESKTPMEKPRIPNYIGECIQKIAMNLSHHQSFINYTFREEMVGDGIENSLKYIDNFNPDKYDKPFNYFTTICWYAFINRIKKEKKQLVIKQKCLENAYLQGALEEGSTEGATKSSVDLNNEYMTNLVSDFENKLKAKKKKSRKTKALEQFYEDENE